MVKKRKSILIDKFSIFLWIAYFFFYLAIEYVILFTFKYGGDLNLKIILDIVLSIISTGIFVLISIFFNRLCTIVTYENGLIKRRGLLGGFHCAIKSESVLKIVKVTIHLDGEFYAIVDGVHGTLERPTKHATIFVPCNEKGVEFIRLFYDGEIPNLQIPDIFKFIECHFQYRSLLIKIIISLVISLFIFIVLFVLTILYLSDSMIVPIGVSILLFVFLILVLLLTFFSIRIYMQFWSYDNNKIVERNGFKLQKIQFDEVEKVYLCIDTSPKFFLVSWFIANKNCLIIESKGEKIKIILDKKYQQDILDVSTKLKALGFSISLSDKFK